MLGDTSLSKIDTAKVQDLINSMMKNAGGTRENAVDDLLMILDEARKGHTVPTIEKKRCGRWRYGPGLEAVCGVHQ